MTENSPERVRSEDQFENLAGVPIRAVNTYARLWLLETWLRALVYVELRASLGDSWSNDLSVNAGSFRSDKSLTHMPTPEMNALSYAPLSKLLELIANNWTCFAPYLPPKQLWDAKLQEVSQVRHRVAHFRLGHTDDFGRVMQLLRDIDNGVWHFCTSYNSYKAVLSSDRDPVAEHFSALDPLPWHEFEPGRWAQFGIRDRTLSVGVNIRVQRRPWSEPSASIGSPGTLYDIRLFAQDGRSFNVRRLLEDTHRLHPHLVHIVLEDENSVRLTIPSVLGSIQVIDLIDAFYKAGLSNAHFGGNPAQSLEILADKWPEYVIGPSNPLSFLDPEMPCSLFCV
ncbi:MAG: hypothetical protein EOP84_26305 [Verrucomicrobiaceae bacterium]|nr:MAG: hypothetical protein EOP84_26305 [Verrucomicrobiaceae bacterium]